MKANGLSYPTMLVGLALLCGAVASASAGDLTEIRERGVLRHLGICYANFVRETDDGLSGLDVELMQRFARHLGVRYEWVPTTWSAVFGDLTGSKVRSENEDVVVDGQTPVRGDLIANGLTILPWRERIVAYSTPTFPTGVWLVARADSPLKPIVPSGDIDTDIANVKRLLKGRSVLTMAGTCLDPTLYDLDEVGTEIRFYTASENLDEIAPAVIDGAADATLLDIPDALIALQKWPGEIKVIGPVSPPQQMGVAVRKNATELRDAFDRFFESCWRDGTYEALVRKYYPAVFLYMEDFFNTDRPPTHTAR